MMLVFGASVRVREAQFAASRVFQGILQTSRAKSPGFQH
jgi:hypothetical protein